VGSRVRAGVFSLPHNFANATGGFGVLIGWKRRG